MNNYYLYLFYYIELINLYCCCEYCCCKYKEIDSNSNRIIYKELDINDLKLDKNIPKEFIDNNKERVYKMIKVFNKDFKYEDIDEILLLLYNLDIKSKGKFKILEVLYNKLSIDKNKMISFIKSNLDNNDIFYIFQYDRKMQFYIWFDKCFYVRIWPSGSEIGLGNIGWDEEIIDKLQKLLIDIFLEKNICNGINFPLDLFDKICKFIHTYFTKEEIYENSKKCEFKDEIELFLKNNKVEMELKNDELSINEPIYIYLNETLDECYQVKDEKQFKVLANNIEQFIIKISSDKVEFFKY